MCCSDLVDKYCYRNSDVLVNNFGIQDQETLNRYESELTRLSLVKLERSPIRGSFNLSYLQKIHRTIFGNIYPFAGKLREVDISKGNFIFASSRYIKIEAEKLFWQLRSEKSLVGLSLENFSKRAAYYMSEINVLHPFREGNGRTQREFIRCLALNSGYILNWHRVDSEILLKASITSAVDTTELKKVIEGCIENKEPIIKMTRTINREMGMER